MTFNWEHHNLAHSNLTIYFKRGETVNVAKFHAYKPAMKPLIQHSAELWTIMSHFPTVGLCEVPATQDSLIEMS